MSFHLLSDEASGVPLGFDKPAGRNFTGSVLVAILFAPCSKGCFAAFIDFGLGVAEDKTDVQMRIFLFDQQMFCPVCGVEDAFGLDDDAVGKDKIGGVGMVGGGDDIGQGVLFVAGLNTCCFKFGSDAVFEATAVRLGYLPEASKTTKGFHGLKFFAVVFSTKTLWYVVFSYGVAFFFTKT